jgi:hypothetical protein
LTGGGDAPFCHQASVACKHVFVIHRRNGRLLGALLFAFKHGNRASEKGGIYCLHMLYFR